MSTLNLNEDLSIVQQLIKSVLVVILHDHHFLLVISFLLMNDLVLLFIIFSCLSTSIYFLSFLDQVIQRMSNFVKVTDEGFLLLLGSLNIYQTLFDPIRQILKSLGLGLIFISKSINSLHLNFKQLFCFSNVIRQLAFNLMEISFQKLSHFYILLRLSNLFKRFLRLIRENVLIFTEEILNMIH